MEINLSKVTKEVRIYIKRQTIYLRQQGKRHQEIADILNIKTGSVANIISDYNRRGEAIFHENIRGRKTGEKRTLSPAQEKEIQEIIKNHVPEDEGIASSLWNRAALSQLIKKKFGIDMPLRSISNYLKRWRMSFQRPTRKNYKQDARKVDEFKNKTYPEIVRKAVTEHAEIMFVDETGINNQEYRVRGYSPIGITPTICSVSQRETVNMISGISIDGTCRYMCYEESMTQQRFIDFMRLITRAKGGHKILMITDNLKIHHGKRVQEWVSRHKDKIEIFFTPPYSPELNPDEYLNHVLKQSIHSGILPKTKADIKKKLMISCNILNKVRIM